MIAPAIQSQDSSTLLDCGTLFQRQLLIDLPEDFRSASVDFADDRERIYRLSGAYGGHYVRTLSSINTAKLGSKIRGGTE